MMRLYGALILFMILSTACGLKCVATCDKSDLKVCTRVAICLDPLNRCFTRKGENATAKGCRKSTNCGGDYQCCEHDMCNNAIPTGPSVILPLISAAITTLFL